MLLLLLLPGRENADDLEANMVRLVLFSFGLTFITDRVSFSTGFLAGLKKELMGLVPVEVCFDGENVGGILPCTSMGEQ